MSQVPPIPPERVQVLTYTYPATSGRPGGVTTLGVLSLILGSLGIVTAVLGGFMSLGFLIASSAATATATLPVKSTVTPTDFAGPRGFPSQDRYVVLNAFAMKRSLSPRQTRQLDFFLSDVGQDILPAVPISANNSSTNESADYAAKFLTGQAEALDDGGVYYEVPIGRLTVIDSSVAFQPSADSSTPAVTRTNDRQKPYGPLTAMEIQAVVDRVQGFSGSTPLTPAQTATLKTRLGGSGWILLGRPADMSALLGGVDGVMTQADGSIIIQFPAYNKRLTISPTGSVSTNAVAAGQARFPKMKTWALATLLTGSGLNVLLAIYLLIVGIFTLRNSLTAGRLHRIYAWLKIVVAIGTSAATWWMWNDFYSGIFSATGGRSPTGSPPLGTISAIFTAGPLIFGLAYPIAILIVLRTKAVRDFYLLR